MRIPTITLCLALTAPYLAHADETDAIQDTTGVRVAVCQAISGWADKARVTVRSGDGFSVSFNCGAMPKRRRTTEG